MGLWNKIFDWKTHKSDGEPLQKSKTGVGKVEVAAKLPELAGKLGDLTKRIDQLQGALRKAPSSSDVVRFNPILELEGLKQNLVAAVNALLTRRDPTGSPIKPADVGKGLERMCSETLENPKWAVPAKVAIGLDNWGIAYGILREIQTIAHSLEHVECANRGSYAVQRPSMPSSHEQKKSEIIRKLNLIKTRCGAAELLVGDIAKAIQTGVAGDGKPTNRRDEVAALAVAAQMIEAEGRQDVAVQLVFLMKEIQDLGDR
jgi:hypothetical protein